MMPHRDVTFPLALLGSLTLHGVLLVVFAREFPSPPVAKLDPAPAPWPERPEPPEVPEPPEATDSLGVSKSDGRATDSSPGEAPQLARLGDQEQALLSLDPAGTQKTSDPQTPPSAQPGTGGAFGNAGAKPLVDRIQEMLRPLEPKEVVIGLPNPTQPPEPYQPRRRPVAGAGDIEPAREPETERAAEQTIAVATPAPEPPAEAPAQPVDRTNPAPSGAPGAAESAGDPRPQAETESHAFSDEFNADFRRGKVVARDGRPHRIKAPPMGLSARYDAVGLTSATLVLKLRLDAQGNVVDVAILHSTGSSSIDQPWKVAAYTWWFEPKKAADENVAGETFPFTLRFF
jgi:outer membrane biosynthesis protein TonB